MSSICRSGFVCLVSLLACLATVPAQTPKDNIQIFARAGHVNHQVGSSQVRRGFSGPSKLLAAGDDLSVGDVVETGANTQLEVLLNPGAVLRVSENARFEFSSNLKQSIRIALLRGSAVIERINSLGKLFSIQVITPTGMAIFGGSGIYRINVGPEGSEFLAIEGFLTLGSRTLKVAAGERVTITPSGVSPITQFDVKSRDGLDTWSRTRAEVLAKANRKLDGRSLRAAIESAETDESLNAAFDGQVGYWAKSSVHDFAVYVPIYTKWRSPYGFIYSNGGRSTTMVTPFPRDMPLGMPGVEGKRPQGRPPLPPPPKPPPPPPRNPPWTR